MARKTTAVAQRREQVVDLTLRGLSQASIAHQLGVTQTTVSRDLKQAEKVWRENGHRNFELAREVELRKLERLEREAWDAWERSQKPSQSAKFRGDAAASGSEKTVRNQYGDPRFLDQINKCIAQRRAILGLDAPLRVADNGPPPAAESPAERQVRLQQIFVAARQAFQNGHDLPALPEPDEHE